MNKQLSPKWKQERGLEIVTIALNPITLTESDSERLKAAQNAAVYADPNMAAANISQAQAEAMKAAAENEAGAAIGFMGMGMAMNAGGSNPADLFAIGQEKKESQVSFLTPEETAEEVKVAEPTPVEWICTSCGKKNDGNFCTNCGAKRPEVPHCKNCGYTPKDPTDLPNFCPQCGTKFEK